MTEQEKYLATKLMYEERYKMMEEESIANAIRSGDELITAIKESEKQQAIAFGEWLCKNHWESCNERWNENGDSVLVTPFWRQLMTYGMKYGYTEKTTEELYQEFLKSTT